MGLPRALGVNVQCAWGSRALLGGYVGVSGAFQGGLGSRGGRQGHVGVWGRMLAPVAR